MSMPTSPSEPTMQGKSMRFPSMASWAVRDMVINQVRDET
jgi:hypothetical protein